MLFPARAVQGVGISLLVTATVRSVLRAKPGQGAAMTDFGFAATIGSVIGIESGGYLTEAFSWRAVFAMSAVLALVLAQPPSPRGGQRPAIRSPSPARRTGTGDPERSGTPGLMVPALLFNFLVFFNYSIWVALPLYTEHRFDTSAEANANLLLVITLMRPDRRVPGGARDPHLGEPVGSDRRVDHRGRRHGSGFAGTGRALVGFAADPLRNGDGRGGERGERPRSPARRTERTRGGAGTAQQRLGLVVGPYVIGALSDAFGYRTPFVVLPIATAIVVILTARGRIPRRNPSLSLG